MSSTLQFLLALAIIVVASKASGYLSARLGQPAVLGKLLAGLLLGPSVLNMLHWPVFSDPQLGTTISYLSHLGVLLLMFIAGLEVDLDSMRALGRPAVLSGVLGVIAPIGLGLGATMAFGFDVRTGIFFGLVLSATSVSISAQCLMDLGALRTRLGAVLLGAAVVDDVLVILLLSLFTALIGGDAGGAMAIVVTILRMLVFVALALLVGKLFLPRLVVWTDRLPIAEGLAALGFVLTLLYAWTAEAVGGMAAITGAFVAGLLLAQTRLHYVIEEKLHTLAYSWLVPVFFVSIGLEANVRTVGLRGLPFGLVIVLVAVVSKVLGSGLGALLGGFSPREALECGVGMTSRGEVGLIVAAVGLEAGLIGDSHFAVIVLMVLATTLLTPVLLRALLATPGRRAPSAAPVKPSPAAADDRPEPDVLATDG